MTDYTAKATALVRRPVSDVFDAFVHPESITRFWLHSTTAPLAKGAKVTWHFMVPGASEQVAVTRFEPPGLIAFDWSDGKHVTLNFDRFDAQFTKLRVEVTGFDGRLGAADAINATEGFAIVLCDLKVWMESGQSPNLVRDKARLIADKLR